MRRHYHLARCHPVPLGLPGFSKSWGGDGLVDNERPEAGPSFVLSVDNSAVSHYSRSAFGPVPLSRSDTHRIGQGGHYQGRHLPFHQAPATHTPRDERTELVSFRRSAKAPHAPPCPARRTVGLDRSLAISRGRTTEMQVKGSCGLGDVCLLTVGGPLKHFQINLNLKVHVFESDRGEALFFLF